MNKICYLTGFFLLSVTFTYGQTAKTSVYFKADKSDLQHKQQQVLDTFIRFLADKDIQKIIVRGNTDSDADSLYNMKLSEQRAFTVKNYLTQQSLPEKLFKTGYFGEMNPVAPNEQDAGKQKNRRVDVIVYYKEIVIIEEKVKKELPQKPVDTCALDTTIQLIQGGNYTINRFDYIKYGRCMRIVEFTTPETILNSGLTTTTTNNEQLVTGGMFEIQLCNDTPLVHPIVIRVPVPFNGRQVWYDACGGEVNYKKMGLWTGNATGTWSSRKKISIVKADTNLFYEFTVIRSGRYNLDYKLDEKNLTSVKTTFISTGGIELQKVSIFYRSPQSLFQQQAKKKNKVQFKLPRCPQNGCECIMIRAEGINAVGDTVVTTGCMNQYKKRILFGKCKFKRGRTAGYVLGFIPVRQKGIYRKYIFEPKDWSPKNPN